MIEVEILESLQKATIEAVKASDVPKLPVKFTAIGFVPPNDQKYLEVVFIPNNEENTAWGSERNYRGLYRLILHWPNDGQGAYPPMRVLRSIAGYFTKDRWLDKVKITNEPDFTGPLEQGTENLWPCGLQYQRFN